MWHDSSSFTWTAFNVSFACVELVPARHDLLTDSFLSPILSRSSMPANSSEKMDKTREISDPRYIRVCLCCFSGDNDGGDD